MANKKISQLPSLTTPASGDQIAIVDVSGTPTTKKVTANNLMSLAPVQSVAGRTGTVTLSNTDISGLGSAATTASTDYATAAQGATADSATQPSDNISTLTNDSNFIDSSGAPVQSVAGRTGTVTLSNTDVSGLGTAALLNSGTSDGNVVVLDATGLPAVDGSQLTGISSAVDGTAVTSTGETGATKFLREDGDGTCSFQDIVVGDTQLRGTDNPHIGAFPNQSLKVIDNPSQSVVVVTDSDGNLDFVVKTDASRAYLNTPSSRLELTTGVSVVEDSTEPDIEITTTSGTYSLITGDSDALGANGLPIRQGFNASDIGANPSPLLISGGTIA
jgi:hypothetical protein